MPIVRGPEPFAQRCIVAARCVWAHLDSSSNLYLFACNIELVELKENLAAFTKCVERELVRNIESEQGHAASLNRASLKRNWHSINDSNKNGMGGLNNLECIAQKTGIKKSAKKKTGFNLHVTAMRLGSSLDRPGSS